MLRLFQNAPLCHQRISVPFDKLPFQSQCCLSTLIQQPTLNNEQPTSNNQQATSNNEQQQVTWDSLFDILTRTFREWGWNSYPVDLTCLICSYVSIPSTIETFGVNTRDNVHYFMFYGDATLYFRDYQKRGGIEHNTVHKMQWITIKPLLHDLLSLGVTQIQIARMYHECSRGSVNQYAIGRAAGKFEFGFVVTVQDSTECVDLMRAANNSSYTSLLSVARSLRTQSNQSIIQKSKTKQDPHTKVTKSLKIPTNPTIHAFEYHNGVRLENGVSYYCVENFKKKITTAFCYDKDEFDLFETMHLNIGRDDDGNLFFDMTNKINDYIFEKFTLPTTGVQIQFFIGSTVCKCRNNFVRGAGGSAFRVHFR